jgi:ADP-heptose:LPS heptosyltransferase
VGIPDNGSRTELFLQNSESAWAETEFQRIGWGDSKPRIALNPTGSWSAKRWPEDHWTGLADHLAGKGIQPLVFWSPGDVEGVHVWASKLGDKVLLAPPTDLRQMAALLSRLDLLVGNDGAPQHIAQALGTPTLTVFGPTWGKSWMPPGDPRHRFLQHFLDCGPCDKTLCPFSETSGKEPHEHKECLKLITPKQVLEQILEMITG